MHFIAPAPGTPISRIGGLVTNRPAISSFPTSEFTGGFLLPRKLAAQKSDFVILKLEVTSRTVTKLRISIVPYLTPRRSSGASPTARCAAIRFVLHCPLAVCRTVANRKSGRRDIPAIEYQRIPFGDPAGHGHCVEEQVRSPLIIAKKPTNR